MGAAMIQKCWDNVCNDNEVIEGPVLDAVPTLWRNAPNDSDVDDTQNQISEKPSRSSEKSSRSSSDSSGFGCQARVSDLPECMVAARVDDQEWDVQERGALIVSSLHRS